MRFLWVQRFRHRILEKQNQRMTYVPVQKKLGSSAISFAFQGF